MPLKELTDIYQKCFPEKNAEAEIMSFSSVYKYEIMDASAFIIYNMVSPDEAEIFDIGTVPEKRQQGLGQKILEKTIADLKKDGVKTIYLEVAENNIPALALYDICGFERYNVRKDYYKSGDKRINAILMKKRI